MTLELAPVDGRAVPRIAPASSPCCTCSASARSQSASAATRRTGRAWCRRCAPWGKVSEALTRLAAGDRGFAWPVSARAWPVARRRGRDVRGGGRRPWPRAAASGALPASGEPQGSASSVLLYGTRRPEDILFRRQIESWRRRLDYGDRSDRRSRQRDWRGHVGVVTKLIPRLVVDAAHAMALLCGPGGDDAICRQRAARHRHAGSLYLDVAGTQYEMRDRPVRPLPVRRQVRLQGRASDAIRHGTPADGVKGNMIDMAHEYLAVMASGPLSAIILPAKPATTSIVLVGEGRPSTDFLREATQSRGWSAFADQGGGDSATPSPKARIAGPRP